MIASERGAVFASQSLDLAASNIYRDVWLQVYIKEWIQYTFGGAISVASTNVPVTIIEDTDFVGNVGDNGAAIEFLFGGGLYCTKCRFQYLGDKFNIPDKYDELIEVTNKNYLYRM